MVCRQVLTCCLLHVVWCLTASAQDWKLTDRNATGVILQYCESETFVAKCGENQVIVMETGRYGRMAKGRCVDMDLGYLGCNASVLHLADQKCSGKQECSIRIPDSLFDSTKPCLKELKTYFEASYICVRVTDVADMCKTVHSVQATSSVSYISSLQIYKNPLCQRVIGGNHQWSLKAQSGQTLNISLVDFSWQPASGQVIKTRQYGYILDKQSGRNYSLLSNSTRDKHVFVSDGSEVQLVLRIEETTNFLIRYQALGCADLRAPMDAKLTRPTRHTAVVKCIDTAQSWHLKCEGRSWVGVIGNCTKHLVDARKQAQLQKGLSPLPHDVTIVIIVAISLLICAVIVVTGLACIKRSVLSRKPCCQGGRQVKYDNVKTDDVMYKEQQDPSYLSPTYSHNRDPKTGKKTKNDYSHIWEHPLPDPEPNRPPDGASPRHPLPQQLKVKLPEKQSRSGYSVNNNTESGGSTQAYNLSMTSKSSDSESKYFVLDKDATPSVHIGDNREPFP